MYTPETQQILRKNIDLLSEISPLEEKMLPPGEGAFPSEKELQEFLELVKSVIFPAFYGGHLALTRPEFIAIRIDKIHTLLCAEIAKACRIERPFECCYTQDYFSKLTLEFIDGLPEIKRLLYADVQAISDHDPSVSEYSEIILAYPSVEALVAYRVAHKLLELNVPLLPRMISEMAHSSTGIDINPEARIGEGLAIDHGTGIVVGQTAILGNHVTLYHGVTLGAKTFEYDDNGHPLSTPRHPIIEDNVTIFANASILGRITVGHDSIIGANVRLTRSVAPYSTITIHSPETTQTNI